MYATHLNRTAGVGRSRNAVDMRMRAVGSASNEHTSSMKPRTMWTIAASLLCNSSEKRGSSCMPNTHFLPLTFISQILLSMRIPHQVIHWLLNPWFILIERQSWIWERLETQWCQYWRHFTTLQDAVIFTRSITELPCHLAGGRSP